MDIRYLRPVGRPVKDKHSCYCKVVTVKGPWRRDGYMKPIECFLLSEEYAPSLPDQMSKPLKGNQPVRLFPEPRWMCVPYLSLIELLSARRF